MNNSIGLTSIYFIDNERGWASGFLGGDNGGGAILATDDGGRTWQRSYTGAMTVYDLQFFRLLAGWALQLPSESGPNEKTALLTTTDGVNWRPVSELDSPDSLQLFDPERGVAVLRPLDGGGSSGDLATTLDGGATWIAVNIPYRVRSSCFADADHGWVTSGSQVLRGGTFKPAWRTVLQAPAELGPNAEADAIWCSGADVAWMSYSDGPSVFDPHYALYRTIDAGVTWHAVLQHGFPDLGLPDSPLGSVSVAIIDRETAYVTLFECERFCSDFGHRSYLLRTNDAGENWGPPIQIPSLQWGADVFFFDAEHGWAAGAIETEGNDRRKARAAILATTDGGKTWTQQYP